LDKTTAGLVNILIFILSGAVTTIPLVLLGMGLVWASLFVLFGCLGVLFFGAGLAEAKGPSGQQSSGQEAKVKVPVNTHRALVIILTILIVAGVNWAMFVGGMLPPEWVSLTVGTWIIGVLWYLGLYLQIGLGLPPSKETALRKAFGSLIALALTMITLFYVLKVAPEPVSAALVVTPVHCFVAYAILDSTIW